VPPVSRLAELAAVLRRIEEPRAEALPEYERWLAMLVAPGSSLGGARPKANFREDDGSLWIAKFPARDDRYDVGAWEYVVHRLAAAAGIAVPASRTADLGEYRTFCVKRFDRVDDRRRMYASAMTLLEREDRDPGGSYVDIAEFIANTGAPEAIGADLAQLFRRVVFNVLAGNRDDRLRNHGFVASPGGWRLAPAFDLNAAPAKVEHALLLDGASAEPHLATVLATAPCYRLEPARARAIVDEVAQVVGTWREVAGREAGLAGSEVERMSSVFDAAY
jgi:serine/threonine-protein kinase HipA